MSNYFFFWKRPYPQLITLNRRAHRPSDVVSLHDEYLAISPLTAPHPCRLRRRAHVIFMSHNIRRNDCFEIIGMPSVCRAHFDAQQDPSGAYKMAVVTEFALASPSHTAFLSKSISFIRLLRMSPSMFCMIDGITQVAICTTKKLISSRTRIKSFKFRWMIVYIRGRMFDLVLVDNPGICLCRAKSGCEWAVPDSFNNESLPRRQP